MLLCESATVDYFAEQFSRPPLARFAQLHDHLEGDLQDCLRDCLLIAEEFAAALGDESFRKEANSIMWRGEIDAKPAVAAMRAKANQLQANLERIFYDSDRLRTNARKYLSF